MSPSAPNPDLDPPAQRGVEHEGARVEHEARVGAEAERLWSAWADPARIAGWFVERAVGRAEEGGRVTWAWDRFGLEVEQEVLVADAPGRLVLRSPQPGGGASVLEITLEADGGETVVRVVQSGFGEGPEAEAARKGAEGGWVLALAMLGHYVERWYGRTKAEVVVMRPVSVGCEGVAPHYRDPSRLSEWLALEGRSITGPVLAEAGPERLRVWEEIDGTLELKAFPRSEGGCTVGVRAMSWKLSRGEIDRLEPGLAAALDRLVERLG